MSYKVSLLTSKKARPFSNVTPAWEQKEIALKMWLPVLKFVVTLKSGHRNFIKISYLYQSCGMSPFSLYLSET